MSTTVPMVQWSDTGLDFMFAELEFGSWLSSYASLPGTKRDQTAPIERASFGYNDLAKVWGSSFTKWVLKTLNIQQRMSKSIASTQLILSTVN